MTRTLLPLLLTACAARTVPVDPPQPDPAWQDHHGPRPVWIDTDPAVGEPNRDVDDGVALLQALRSPELDVVGVSTVFGNAPLDRADPIGRELVAAWAPDVPVHTGAAEARRDETPAVTALEAALEAQPLTILVLGPATNVANLLVRRPDLAERMVEVIAVAGRLPGQRFTTGTANPRAHRDFNFEQDPDAFAILLAAGVPVTLAPFEISRKVWVTAEHLDGWTGDATRLVAPARGWLGLWTDIFGVDGFNPFDTLAIGVLTTPELLDCTPGKALIEVGPDDRTEAAMQGTDTPDKPYLVVRPDGPGAPVTWCHDVRSEPFLADLTRRLTTPAP